MVLEMLGAMQQAAQLGRQAWFIDQEHTTIRPLEEGASARYIMFERLYAVITI